MGQSVSKFAASLQKFYIIPLEIPADRMNHVVVGNQYGVGGHPCYIPFEKPSRRSAVHGAVRNSKAPDEKKQQKSATIKSEFFSVILCSDGP